MIWATDKIQNSKIKSQNFNLKFKIHLFFFCKIFLFVSLFGAAFAFTQTPTLTPQAPSLLPSINSSEGLPGADSFSFVVFGDCHVGRSPEEDRVCRDLIMALGREKDVDFVVNLGDFADHGKKEAYEKYLKMVSGLGLKIYYVPGNHDLAGSGYKYYKKHIGQKYYYSFDHGNSHFIVLNNAYGHSFDAKQFAWLKEDLAATKKKHIFVFMHRPTFDPGEIFSGYAMSGREVVKRLLQLFSQHRVAYVFAGHIHGYASSKRNGTVYIVSGGGGGPLHLPRDFGGFHHYVKIKVEGGRIFDKIVKVYD